MKKFLAVYIGTPAGFANSEWNTQDADKRKQLQTAGVKAWGEWVAANKNSIVDVGSPLGKTKQASPQGITDTKNALTAYTVVQAETHEAAARIFDNHPHFTIFPGDSVEIMECLPIPGQ